MQELQTTAKMGWVSRLSKSYEYYWSMFLIYVINAHYCTLVTTSMHNVYAHADGHTFIYTSCWYIFIQPYTLLCADAVGENQHGTLQVSMMVHSLHYLCSL